MTIIDVLEAGEAPYTLWALYEDLSPRAAEVFEDWREAASLAEKGDYDWRIVTCTGAHFLGVPPA